MRKIFVSFTAFLFVFFSGCSSSPPLQTGSKLGRFHIKQVALDTVRYRRPDHRVENPAYFFNEENKGLPKCKSAPEIFPEAFVGASKEVRTCLNSIQSGKISYDLILEDQPYLKLDADKNTPACVVSVLSAIPVPREVFFLGLGKDINNEGTLECSAVGVNVDKRAIMDVEPFWERYHYKLDFPVSRELKTDRDLKWWLSLLYLKAYMQQGSTEEGRFIDAIRVPNWMCKACYDGDPDYKNNINVKLAPVLWP